MIGLGKFGTSVRGVRKLLKSINFLEDSAQHPMYSKEMPSIMRNCLYRDAWKLCLDKKWYDCVLSDSSILQFHRTDTTLSYSYLEVPYEIMDFEEFASTRLDDNWHALSLDDMKELEPELRKDYELYLGSDLAERSVTPLRYDYEPERYRCGVHPAAHVHFGLANEIRLCSKRIMNPVSFTLFVIRQFYPNAWEHMIAAREADPVFREVRENLMIVPPEFMQKLDCYEMQLE